MPELSPEIVEAIAYVVGVLVALMGPRPLKKIFDAVGLPGGAVRVLATYIASGAVAVAALGIAGAFSGADLTLDGIVRLSLLVVAAAQVAYHRLKDAGSL